MSIDKIRKEIANLSVLELAQLVKELKEEYGISDVMPVAAAPAAAAAPSAAAPAEEEKSEFKVTLKDAGSEKIKVIKALRTVTSLTLKEAKDLVESAPTVVAESATKEDAKKMKEALEAAGAKVELS